MSARTAKLLAGVLLAFLIAMIAWASTWSLTDAPDRINGDSVGMDTTESFVDYQQRTATQLAAAPADQPAFALVTFATPRTAEQLGQALQGVQRVSAMVVETAIVPLPEPVAGEDRGEVFNRQFAQIAASLAGVGEVPTPTTALSVVVWDTGEHLRELAIGLGEELGAIDVLPPDAVWGSFGIRPVIPPGVETSIYRTD